MCFVWIWEQTAIISLYSVNWLVCITETECVYCAVRTASLYIIQVMCFVWIWEQTTIISLYSINWLVCITETAFVLCYHDTWAYGLLVVHLHAFLTAALDESKLSFSLLCAREKTPRHPLDKNLELSESRAGRTAADDCRCSCQGSKPCLPIQRKRECCTYPHIWLQ
jgi:hypothetical protein